MAIPAEARLFADRSGPRLAWYPTPQQEGFPAARLTSLPELLGWAQGQGQRVKHGVHRSVFRVPGEQGAVYVKHYRAAGLLRRVQQLLRGSPARREFRHLQRARQLGLPVPEAVAWGQSFSGPLPGDSVLVTREVPQARVLSEVLAQVERLPAPQRVARLRVLLAALARLCAQMHDAGVQLADFHPDNLLVTGPVEHPRLVLIDLPSMSFSTPLGPRQAARNLAVLLATLWEHRSGGRVRLFWAEYLRHRRRRPGSSALAAMAAEILQQAVRHRLRVAARRDKRALRNNKDFHWEHSPCGRFGSLRRVPEELRREVKQLVAKDSPSEIPPEVHRWRCVGVPAPWWCRLPGTSWRWHPALRRWQAQHALAARGIPCLVPEMVFVPRGGQAAVLLYPRPPQLVPWSAWSRQNAKALPEPRRQQLAQGWGCLLGRLHFWGYTFQEVGAEQVLLRAGEDHLQLLLGPEVVLRPGRRRLNSAGQDREYQQVLAMLRQAGLAGEAFRRAYRRELWSWG